MGVWAKDSQTDVAHMDADDFYGAELATTMEEANDVKISFFNEAGEETVLKASTVLEAGEVIDATRMRAASLQKFYQDAIDEAKRRGILLSLHLKATMMKVSDPIMFGFAVKVYFKDLIAKHGELFDSLGVNFNNGLGDLYSKLDQVDAAKKKQKSKLILKQYMLNNQDLQW